MSATEPTTDPATTDEAEEMAQPIADVHPITPAPTPEPKRKRKPRRRRRRLTTAERQAQAQQAWRDSGGDLSGAALGEMFDRSERWGRDMIRAAQGEDATDEAAILPQAEAPPDGAERAEAGPVADRPAEHGPAVPPPAMAPGPAHGWQHRLVAVGMAVPMVLIGLAPVLMSFLSLSDFAVAELGLTRPAAYVFPVALDLAALLCASLTFHAVMSGDGSAGPRALLWALVAGSAALNYRHGGTISPDAALVYGAMPVVAAVLFDLVLRRVRRGVLKRLGVIEAPLARYRTARWLVAPAETFGAWKTSVKENVSGPADALALYRSQPRKAKK